MADGNGNGNGKGALHQLLAVEPSLKGAASKILAETRKTFTGKQTHFHESQRRYVCSIENDPGFPDESSPMSTTVGEKLAHVAEVVGPFIDAGLQIDRTNQEAVADLAFGDKTIANIPSTALLRLDHRLGELRQIMDSIPTLDPNTSWTADSDMGKGIWKAEEEVKHRTFSSASIPCRTPSRRPSPRRIGASTARQPSRVTSSNSYSATSLFHGKGGFQEPSLDSD
jgi:hypothetical protein